MVEHIGEDTPQMRAEEHLRAMDAAPIPRCMDYALGIVADYQASFVAGHDDPARPAEFQVRLDVVAVLGLALYQAGVDQHAAEERGVDEIGKIRPDRVRALLADPALSRALLWLEPGHPAVPDGRARREWLARARELRGDAAADWPDLLRQVTSAFSHAASSSHYRILSHLNIVPNRWNAFGWYNSPTYPEPPELPRT